mmetsp:Transcript_16077/g.29244  ORF Transcript_16077/g.29244 Transcript_16077/m.29244 type:complete len:295 (-) Transcript_16077:516-1400(-)
MLQRWHCLQFPVKQTRNGKVCSKHHAQEGRPMIQSGSEIPFPHSPSGSSKLRFLAEEGPVHETEHSSVKIPEAENENANGKELQAKAILAVVDIFKSSHRHVYHDEEVCVEWADIVENVSRSLAETQKDDEKIQPPKHLHDTNGRIVRLEVEKGKVSKSSHPNVASNHDTDGVVDFFRVVIMIKQEHELHPAFPFFRLVSVENVIGRLDTRYGFVEWCHFGRAVPVPVPVRITVLECDGLGGLGSLLLVRTVVFVDGVGRGDEEKPREHEELVSVVRLVGVRKWRVILANVGEE